MICKNCGKENDANMKFCGECGSRLTDILEEIVVETDNSVSSNTESVFVQETMGDVEEKPKKHKSKIIVAFVAVVAVFICVFAIFGNSGKINGVSADTYQECTRIMKLISNEAYINKTASKVESALYQEYGTDLGSVTIGELRNYIFENSGLLELSDDITNIPMSTINDEILAKFVVCQYAFVIEEILVRGSECSVFTIMAPYKISNTGCYVVRFDECKDIYGNFILKYKLIYNNANDIEDIQKEIEEMSFFAECTSLLG